MALVNSTTHTQTQKPRLRDRTNTAWFNYDIQQGNGAGLFLQPRGLPGASAVTTTYTGWYRPTTTDTYTADGVRGSWVRAPIGSGGGGICWDKLAGLSWAPRRRRLAAATGRVVDCDGDALLHSAGHIPAVMLIPLPDIFYGTDWLLTGLVTRVWNPHFPESENPGNRYICLPPNMILS